ncbi:unnamed protein product [Leptosia nina]|uniref:Uncharacterized protein n=1 Tax=Leptosia nina TaxID=320188 RepID=A0AAV1JFU1_9NEOP
MIKFFQRRAKQDYSDISDADKLILNLFANETKWIQRIVSFGFSKLKGHTTDEIEYMLSTWPIYVSKIDSVDQDVPSPEKSDECLASLGNMSLHSRTSTKCTINRSCEEVLKNGTNYGYALTHRLMFMSMARFSHGCSVFSPAEDQYLTNRFCSMLYVEAESIEKHNFANGLIDLMLEIIALCGLHGHEQFLSGPWLQRLKRFQVSAGCFGFIMNDANYMIRQQKPRKWKLNRSRDHDIMDGHCNSHATTLAMCAYAEAVRFILEMYY